MGKVRRIILRDSADSLFDDLITFKEEIELEKIYGAIQFVKDNVEDYTNEDIYNALKLCGNYELDYIGDLDIVLY